MVEECGHPKNAELHLMVSPNGVGSGTAILDSAVDLDLLEARRFEGSANVLLRYAVRLSAQ